MRVPCCKNRGKTRESVQLPCNLANSPFLLAASSLAPHSSSLNHGGIEASKGGDDGGLAKESVFRALRALCWTGESWVSMDLTLDLFGKILKFFLGVVPSPWLDRCRGLSLAVTDPRRPSGRCPSHRNQ